MAVEHKTLSDPELHEPKGASTAAAHTIYVADGVGSGSFQEHAGSTHGEIYLADASISVGPTGGTITSDVDYVVIGPTWSENPDAWNIGLHADNKSITVSIKGHYLITAFASFTTGATAAGTQYAMKFRINETTYSARKLVSQKEGAGTRRMNLSGSALVMLNSGDKVDLILGSSAIDTLTVSDVGLSLILLHEVA